MQSMNFLDELNLAGVLAACLVAMLLGAWLARKQARAFKGQTHNGHPAVTFSDYGDMRFLHLDTPAVQGSMKLSQPFDIHLEYVQRMMAWLLFVELHQVPRLQAMQLGLGAASLTKFCHHHLKMRTAAVELNPQVIETCRRWFHLPENSAQLNVLLGDAADIARHPEWQQQIDVLQVDLYDPEARRPVLDSADFYRDCHHLLTPSGCMVVNVFGAASNVNESIANIKASFGDNSVWAFAPTTAGNSIVLAFRTPYDVSDSGMLEQARTIEARWPLPATKWLNALARVA